MSTLHQPKCVASTVPHSYEPGAVQSDNARTRDKGFFKSAEWTADGTTVIATTTAGDIQTIIIPPDLLEIRVKPHELKPYSVVTSKEPVNTVAAYPYFDLQNPATTLILSSIRDHPIRLNSALSSDLLASYALVNPRTEAFITPSSLLFVENGSRFVAGSESSIYLFDLSRPGNQPLSSFATGSKKRHSSFNPLTNLKGIVSTLAIETESGILAAGTFTRHVGLYESSGNGQCVGVFTVQGTVADKKIRGQGITQLAWSPCGRYLYIAERKSDGLIFYDIRNTGQLVGWLRGRQATTNQRLGFDIAPNLSVESLELWAGGIDGKTRVWQSPHQKEGEVSPDFEWSSHDESVTSSVTHPGGAVLATCSARRYSDLLEEVHGDQGNPKLKIWLL